MASLTVASPSRGKKPLTIDGDIKRILELLDFLRDKDDITVPREQMAQLKEVLESSFFCSVKEVYEHVYNTVDEEGSVSGKATATAKATIAAFAASEGQGHPRIVELEKVITHTHIHTYIKANNCVYFVRTVYLNSQTDEGFGFNVMGGSGQKCPIYISRVIPGGYSDRHGGIRRGDQLLSVNGVNLEEATHETAIDVLKATEGAVKLVVKYSPKILEEMEFRFEHTKSFRRGGRHSTRH
ncbi:protein lin-7 homolog C-like isoform X1 [Halichondria panicea]|uniref:protein lin-7 homolog C-like isoform X1 n=1 Tax=Halichondria panicea TaxID=6063 RepID=UPI00312B7513